MPAPTQPFPYDAVRYPAQPVANLDPARLCALATLLGRAGAPFQDCRVLEIGCGEGINLINLAIMAPGSQFLGFDLAGSAIARARETADLAGIHNVEFRQLDLLQADASLGTFDYILANGVYSWVPEPVRDALMRLLGRCLSPRGLAYVSYNVLPGCHLREMLRDILLAEVGHIEGPARKMAAVRARLATHAARWEAGDDLSRALGAEARWTLSRGVEVTFHDELGFCYAPRLFGDVAAHARGHGLAYLCDADIADMEPAVAPDGDAMELLRETGGDWLAFQQARDFRFLTRYRESVFCRAGPPLDYTPDPARLSGFSGMARFFSLPREPNKPQAFQIDGGGPFESSDPAFAACLAELARAQRRFVPLQGWTEPDIQKGLLDLAFAKALELRSEPLSCTYAPGERPLASPLARLEARRGADMLPSLGHFRIKLDPMSAQLLQLMDGSRTRVDLARDLALAGAMPADAVARALPNALQALTSAALVLA